MVDTISHGLWSFIIFSSAIVFPYMWLAIFFGMMPDLFSWTIYALYSIFRRKRFGKPNLRDIPRWAFTLYGITHSIFVCSFVFLIVYLLFHHIPIYLFAWPIHILFDIPTHSRKFLPTPFLWPFFKWKFPGISWAEPWLLLLDWLLIIVLMVRILLF